MGILEENLNNYGIDEAKEKTEKLRKYIRELEDKRRWGGLVSIGFKDNSEEIIADSMMVLKEIDKEKEFNILDIGSGGGIVGVTISIICENWKVTMVEKSQRKSAFLAEIKTKLNLQNAEIINKEAEKLIGRKEYDYSITRAAGKIKDIIEIGLGTLRNGGRYIAIKGRDVEKEIEEAKQAIEDNGGKLVNIIRNQENNMGKNDRIMLVVVEKLMG